MTPNQQSVCDIVQANADEFISWPSESLVLLPGVARNVRYHQYPDAVAARLQAAGIRPNTLSNGPAICAFLLAGGVRPMRNTGTGWHIHHIYDGRFSHPGRETTTHAVQDGRYFTASAGLVAMHPISDAMAHEYSDFAWWLRRQAFERFDFDPDGVFG